MSDDYSKDIQYGSMSEEIIEEENYEEPPQQAVINMNIAAVDFSIQGEGVRIGSPSLIIRFNGCNKRCLWCDVPKRKNDRRYNQKSMPVMLQQYVDTDLVISGGEPFMQAEALGYIINLATTFKMNKGVPINISVETNGSIPMSALRQYVDESILQLVLWSISPKLHTSGEKIIDTQFHDFARMPNTQYKITMNPFDPDDVLGFKTLACLLPESSPIIISPVCKYESYDIEGYQKALLALADIAMDCNNHRVRVLPQLQKIIWGLESESN
jgi:organic radical activating enzyme